MKKTQKWKQIISMLCILLLAVAMLGGCGTAPAGPSNPAPNNGSPTAAVDPSNPAPDNGSPSAAIDPSNLVVGLSMQTLGGAYFATQESVFKDYCSEKGITCYTTDAQGDMSKQLSDVEDLISRGCNIIVINPKDPMGAVAATESCAAAGIPVFIMDNSIDPSATYVSMIQSDNYSLGEMVGIDVAEKFGTNQIKIGMLSGNAGNALGVNRRMGVMKGIMESQLAARNYTSVEILTQGWGNWNQQDGLAAAEDMLMAAPEINCIVAENDDMLLGALQAVEAANRSDIVLVGADGQKGVYELIQNGSQVLATGRNDPKECAIKTMDTVIAYANGQSVPALVYLDPVSVSPKNVSSYYDPNSLF